MESIRLLQVHMTKAIDAKDHSCITRTKLSWRAGDSAPVPECTHCAFDFAQQATTPYHARQVGQLYFCAPKPILQQPASSGVEYFREDG